MSRRSGRAGEPAVTAAPRSAAEVLAFGLRAALREPALTGVAGLGLALALLGLGAVALRGPFIPPEGKMLDAVTFNFGVSVFTLTVALLLPLAGYSQTGRRRARWAFFSFAAYGLVLEPLQAFRGLDPRFSAVAGPPDQIAGGIFGLTAIALLVVSAVLGVRFFRRDVLPDRPVLRLGIRYGAAAVGLSFGAGVVMIVIQGRIIGDGGNLLPVHGLGVHGIQTVPAVALLAAWARPGPRARTWVHAAGIAWVAACAAALVQAILGRPPMEPAPLPMVMAAGVALWSAVVLYLFLAWRATARHPSEPTDSKAAAHTVP